MIFRLTEKFIFVLIFSAIFVLNFSTSVEAITPSKILNGRIEGTPQFLLLGDRVELTLRVYSQNNTLLTQDHKYRFKILNPKPGQECQTTDESTKDDGMVRGFCEAKGDSGNMEVMAETDERSTFQIGDDWYEPYVYPRYNVNFYNPTELCKEGVIAPHSVSLLKQNDVTVKIDWQNSDKFIGTYDVLFGTTAGEYSSKRRTENKSLIIDGLDPSKEYYFKVQANSACKWVAASSAFKYIPRTGGVSSASDTATASIKPSAKAATSTKQPVVAPDSSPQPTPSPETIQESSFPEIQKSPEPSMATSLPAQIWQSITTYFKRLFSKK